MVVDVPEHARRKYADLMFTGSRLQWAMWDPAKQITCGDYGTFNEENGEFEKEGNIYNEGYVGKYGIHNPLTEEEKTKELWTISKNARALNYGKDAKMSMFPPDTAEISKMEIRGHIKFQGDRGACLVALDGTTTEIPKKTLLKKLIDEPTLHNKFLVSEVLHCSKYARYLSGLQGGEVWVGHNGKEWVQVGVNEEAGDAWQTGSEDQPAFFPLFRLLAIRDRGPILLLRDSPEPEDPKELLAPLYPPWGSLDDEGEQIPGSELWGVSSEEDFLREAEEDEKRYAQMLIEGIEMRKKHAEKMKAQEEARAAAEGAGTEAPMEATPSATLPTVGTTA